jgi:hypothetical protein
MQIIKIRGANGDAPRVGGPRRVALISGEVGVIVLVYI